MPNAIAFSFVNIFSAPVIEQQLCLVTFHYPAQMPPLPAVDNVEAVSHLRQVIWKVLGTVIGQGGGAMDVKDLGKISVVILYQVLHI